MMLKIKDLVQIEGHFGKTFDSGEMAEKYSQVQKSSEVYYSN